MINLLLVFDQMNTTTEVNLCGTKSIFDDCNHVIRIRQAKKVSQDDLEWCDACYANRPSSIYMVRISQALKASGRIFMSLYDDDLMNLPKGNSGRWSKKYVKKCLAGSDIVVTPNPLIANSFKDIDSKPKYVVINTHVREEEIKPISNVSDKIRIVYAAGLDHTELFDMFLKPSLDQLYERFSRLLELTLIGIRPDLSVLKHSDWIRQIDTMSYDQYKQYMNSHDFDIGLAPLVDNSFSNRKYFNKFFEYSKNGILGLYSNCLPYTLVIKNGKNGILVDNNLRSWYEALCHAIENMEIAKTMVIESQKQLRKEFSVDAIRKVIETEIDSYVGQHLNKIGVSYTHSPLSELQYEFLVKWHQFTSHVYKDGFFSTVNKIIETLMRSRNNESNISANE